MTLIVEDGTGLTTAESYVSVAAADSYCTSHGLTGWAAKSTTEKEVALRVGTSYIDQRYRYQGTRSFPGQQALAWPRGNVWHLYDGFYVEGIPADVKNAQIEAAYRSLTSTLLPDTPGNTEGFLTMISEEVGGQIRETKQYASGISPQMPRFRVVDDLVRPYLGSNGATTERA